MRTQNVVTFSAALYFFVLVGPVFGQEPIQHSETIAPSGPLAEGWQEIDQRLIFLTIRLANTETTLDAIVRQLGISSSKLGQKYSESRRADLKNEKMDGRGGGPMNWQDFYGRTAENFFYHPTDRNSTYYTIMVLGQNSPANDKQSVPGVPSRQGLPVHQRPPQFDYIYRANESAKARAQRDAAEIKDDIASLQQRLQQLEAEQAGLWVEIAFRAVSHFDLDKKPIYRFEPQVIGEDPDATRQTAIVKSVTEFLRVALSVVERAQSDQATTFGSVKQAVADARLRLSDELISHGIDVSDRVGSVSRFAALAKRLDDVAANLSESYVVSMEGDLANDLVRKETFRGLLQESLVSYAQIILAMDEMVELMVAEWKVSPNLSIPTKQLTEEAQKTQPHEKDSKPDWPLANPILTKGAIFLGTVTYLGVVSPAQLQMTDVFPTDDNTTAFIAIASWDNAEQIRLVGECNGSSFSMHSSRKLGRKPVFPVFYSGRLVNGELTGTFSATNSQASGTFSFKSASK